MREKIAIIRIKGLVGVPKDIKDTLEILRLRRKFVCSVFDLTKVLEGMLKKVQYYVAYGPIDEEIFKLLLLKRGRLIGDKKIPEEKISEIVHEFFNGKKLQEFKVKPFFRLHPPRGGFKKSTKEIYPKGVLGNHGKKIKDLILRML